MEDKCMYKGVSGVRAFEFPSVHEFGISVSPGEVEIVTIPAGYTDVTKEMFKGGVPKNLKFCKVEYMLPAISEVIFNEEAGVTVVIWIDGEKTIVRLGEGEHFDRYTGFMAAVCKRMFGGTTPAKKLMNAKDRKYQAQLKAEAAAKEKAKRIVEAEKQREKAKQRHEKEEREGFDALVQYYVREFLAKDKAREMMVEQAKVPFDNTEDNA